MNRALFLLAFLNLAFLAYASFVDPPQRTPAAAPAAAPRLRLIGEGARAGARCVSVGPLASEEVAGAVARWLQAQQLASRTRRVELDAPPTYWVSLPPTGAAQAQRLAQKLHAAGVSDVEVMAADGAPAQSVVSLGLYSDRDRAEKRVAELTGPAIKPTVTEQPHRTVQWWLDLELADSEPAPQTDALTKAVDAAAGAGIVTCPATGPAPAENGAAPAPAAGKLATAPA